MSYCRVIYFCLQKYLNSDAVKYKAAFEANGSDILNKVGMIQQINPLKVVTKSQVSLPIQLFSSKWTNAPTRRNSNVAESAFPQGVTPTLMGAPTYHLTIFPKTAWKWRILGKWGGGSACPLNPRATNILALENFASDLNNKK